MPDDHTDKRYLDRAARAALRAMGDTDPNPMVGAVIVSQTGETLGIGHHRLFGEAHAEREALGAAASSGHDVRGATLYCTLEPCRHHGKQPPCSDAIIDSGIGRVVVARQDPGAESGGGAQILRRAGIPCDLTDASPLATALAAPLAHRSATGRPWIMAKWAQTIDGVSATRTGESQWLTSGPTRRRVHRLRARVDAVVVGIGTVLADDPMLTPRGLRRVRRRPARVVLDTHGRIPPDSALARTAAEHRTIVITRDPARIAIDGVETIACAETDGRLDLGAAMSTLWRNAGFASVLVEPGPTLLGSLIEHDLINEAFVHIAPVLMGDEHGRHAAIGRACPALTDARRLSLARVKRIGHDLELHYRRADDQAGGAGVQNASDSDTTHGA